MTWLRNWWRRFLESRAKLQGYYEYKACCGYLQMKHSHCYACGKRVRFER